MPATANSIIYVSSTSGGAIGSLSFRDEDILVYNTDTLSWAMYMDGSDIGLARTDVDAFAILNDGSLLLSISVATSIPPLGIVDDSDIVRFIPTSIGSDTQGLLEIYFDGSDVGLSSNGEDIKAISVLGNGHIIISTTGSFSVDGALGKDEDLVIFTPTSLGSNTSGAWAIYFDGSDVGMGNSSSEDVWGVTEGPSGELYITTRGRYSILALSGSKEDIFTCMPTSLEEVPEANSLEATSPGVNTFCSYQYFWMGYNHRFSNETLDAIHVSGPSQ